MTTAFTAPTPLARTTISAPTSSLRMCARIPGDTAAPPSKYSQYINASRLNKAPLITINAFPNADYNNVSVSLATLTADEGAAASIARPDGHNPSEGADPSLWSAYYSPDTVNTAPFVWVMGSAAAPNSCALGVTMTEVPLQVDMPQSILDNSFVGLRAAPDGSAALTPAGNNSAPVITLNDCSDPSGADSISVAMVEQPLNLAAAEYILNLYR